MDSIFIRNYFKQSKNHFKVMSLISLFRSAASNHLNCVQILTWECDEQDSNWVCSKWKQFLPDLVFMQNSSKFMLKSPHNNRRFDHTCGQMFLQCICSRTLKDAAPTRTSQRHQREDIQELQTDTFKTWVQLTHILLQDIQVHQRTPVYIKPTPT